MVSLFLYYALWQNAEIRTTVPLVVAPVSVTDRDGRPVGGLAESDFLVQDSGVARPHRLEVTNQPLSMVFAIQTNRDAGPALAKLIKVGSMVQPLLAGEGGRVAVLRYSDEVRIHQDFTGDGGALASAFATLRPGGHGSSMLDAVAAGTRLLDAQPVSHRKVMVVIGESRDRTSEAKLADVMEDAVRSSITIYPVSFSVYLTALTSKGGEKFGKKADEPPVFGSSGASGFSILSLLAELARLGSANAAEALAKSTGGEKLSFVRLKGLEEVVTRLSEELHNQYLLTFTPGAGEPGYRAIRVLLKNRPDLALRTRPGYWLQP
jgi:VWFA-related protein